MNLTVATALAVLLDRAAKGEGVADLIKLDRLKRPVDNRELASATG